MTKIALDESTKTHGAISSEPYFTKLLHAQSEFDRANSLASMWLYLRNWLIGAGFLLIVAAWWLSLNFALVSTIVAVLIVVAMIASCMLWHCETKSINARHRVEINRLSIARRSRRWSELVDRSSEIENSDSPIATDLNLFGQASVFQMMSVAETPNGIQTLGRWLLEPASPLVVVERQLAVDDISNDLDWRQTFQHRCRIANHHRNAMAAMVDWGEAPDEIVPDLAMSSAILMNVFVLMAIGLILSGWVPPVWPWIALVGCVVINLVVTTRYSGPIHSFMYGISPNAMWGESNWFSALIAHVQTKAFKAPLLIKLKKQLEPASVAMPRLERFLMLINLSRNPMMVFLVYVPLQFFFLWDLHVFRFIKKWRRQHGKQLPGWMDAIGQLEAICSLASLKYDHPDWSFPNVDESRFDRISAESMGHPLFLPGSGITNDVEIGPRGSILVVTGSNMSGKSTLLRSVGVNVMLAQAGAPVCARRMTMPTLHVATSMRITDSLDEATSLFMAELMRLKEIVDLAKSKERPQKYLLFLLDEILHGTNSGERREAVIRVVNHLCRSESIGAISTHDLGLTEHPNMARYQKLVHFRDSVTNNADGQIEMSFDYQLRPGPATTSNAIHLLDMLGLKAIED